MGVFFMAAAAFCVFLVFGFSDYMCNLVSSVIIAPFLRPANGVGDTPPLPYYLYVLLYKLGHCFR